VPSPQTRKIDLAQCRIHVVGPNILQNELMAAHLEKETGGQCQCWEDLRELVADSEPEAGEAKTICLVDCMGLDLDRFMVSAENFDRHLQAGRTISLFNVAAGLGIEGRAVAMGLRGVFYPEDPLDRLVKGIAAMFDGELWVSRRVMTDVILKHKVDTYNGRPGPALLTRRETEILELMAIGVTNDDIADKLCISPNTVKTHIYNIFKKIDVPNRLQAALWAAKNL
jgi:LuxR family transcriptional regulator, positive regulator of biofilm formation